VQIPKLEIFGGFDSDNPTTPPLLNGRPLQHKSGHPLIQKRDWLNATVTRSGSRRGIGIDKVHDIGRDIVDIVGRCQSPTTVSEVRDGRVDGTDYGIEVDFI
jgi:hypothetical protein